MRSTLLFLACVVAHSVTAAPAFACQAPESPAAFIINHETYGDIGTHVLNFACEGDDLIVETEVDVKVKVLFVTAYQRQARYREVWRDDRLISYEARTNDGGEVFVTTAWVDGGEMVVDGLKKGVRVPLNTVSSHPWNIDAVDRAIVFGQRDGRIHRVNVETAGEETVRIGGKSINARKYVVRGDLERELLYGPDGTWLQWRLKRDGKAITITRQ
jgi:hypothetical protein